MQIDCPAARRAPILPLEHELYLAIHKSQLQVRGGLPLGG